MKHSIQLRWFVSGIALCCLAPTSLTQAQIVPDATLPQNSSITLQGNTGIINGGTRAGGNLFHSFEQFSVPTGSTAYFNNAGDIQNIFSRVTGSSISTIDGLIAANSITNLFVINPNGIIFGPNARLNIGGSFISSTAESIKFADGSEFSAKNPSSSPLLTVNVPLGLQYGSNPGGILVQGPGNNLRLNRENFEPIRNNRPAGLTVQPSQTLALVGGNVSLEGGNLTAPGGRIELGSVNEVATVKLTPTNPGWSLSYEGVGNFQDIRLSGAASADTSGSGGGNIQVQGRRVTLTQGSAILTDTLGSSPKGSLTVRASEAVELIGTSANIFSGLFANVASGATGTGGNLTIETRRLLVDAGAQVGANTFGEGDAGALTVRATEVELISGSPFGPSGLFTVVAPGGTGNGGNLTIETGRLRILDGAQVIASTFGAGNAGSMTVKAAEMELISASPNGALSGLIADVASEATGIGGNLTIETGRLRLLNGAQISTGTFGSGEAGSLTVRATEVELIGTSNDFGSGLYTASGGIGNGGNLTIDTERLRLADGAQIAASTYGSGNAGELTVRATESVELIGTTPFGGRSGLFASAIFGTGDGGDLKISTNKLTVRDGATINASNFSSLNPNIPPGQGKAGNIEVDARSLLLDNTLPAIPGGITASTNSGGGGNIVLQVQDEIITRNGSQISAETLGSGKGGSVNITTNSVQFSDGGKISTNSTGSGTAGNISILANQIQSKRGEITATSTQTGGGDINLTTNLLLLKDQGLISTSVLYSIGGGGNITIDTDSLVALEDSDLRANAVLGPGGNIQISTQAIFLSPDSEITASSQYGLNGLVNISRLDVDPSSGLVILPQQVVDVSGLITQGCPGIKGNVGRGASEFIVTGRGGLPDNPSNALSSDAVWVDLSTPNPTQENRPSSKVPTNPTSLTADPIVEASSWAINDWGEIVLTASAPSIAPQIPQVTHTTCQAP